MDSALLTISLARRANGGDAEALGDLLAELRPLVVQTARLVVGAGPWLAEDTAQEALLDETTRRFSQRSTTGKLFTVTVHQGRIASQNVKPYALVF